MTEVVSDDRGLKLTGHSLESEVVLDPVIIRTRFLSDDPTWLDLLPAKVQNALIVLNMKQSPAKDWVLKVV